MLTSEIRDSLLVDELQLGQTLNHAVHEGFAAQFHLLISMLSDDVRDQAWVADPVAQEKQTEDLRKKFALGDPVRLQSGDGDAERGERLGDIFREGGIDAVRLEICLNPEPLTLRHEDIPPSVIDFLTPLQREKLRYANEKGNPSRVAYSMSPEEVLDAVSESRMAGGTVGLVA